MMRSIRVLWVGVLLSTAVFVLPTVGGSSMLRVANAAVQSSGFQPMSPVVVLDTAKMIGYTKKTSPRTGTTTIADLSKLASLPKSGDAILAVQVTVRAAAAPVSVKVFSTGTSTPSAPQIMAPKGSSATTVLVPYTSGRTLSLRISGSAHIAVSLSGWFSGDAFSSKSKSRFFVAAQRKNDEGEPIAQTLSSALPVSAAGVSLVALRLETNALTAGVITISQVLTAGKVKQLQIPATKVAVPDGSSTQHILVPVVSGAKLKVALPAGTASTIDLLGVVTETAKFSLAPLSATILLKKEVSSVKVANGSYLNGTGSAALLVTVKSKKATSLYVYPHKQARPVAVSLAGPSGSFTRLLFVSPGSDGLVDIVTSGSSASVTVKSLGSFDLPSGAITPAASILESSAVISSSVVAKDGTASATIAGTLRPGSVVVLPASADMPNGYIGRVLTSTSVGGSSAVTMEAGSFLDVMPTSALDINLDTGDITLSNQGGVLAQGVGAMSSAPKSKRFEAGCEGSMSAGGKLEPTFSYDLGTVHIESGGVIRPYVELYLQPYVTAAFTASVSAGIECKLDAQLGEVPLPTITGWVFFIPVIWSHEIRFNLIGNFKASISASYELSASASAKLGVRMGHDSEVYRSAEFKSKSAPAWEAVADGSLWLNAEYKGGLYGALGLIAGIGPELSLNVDAQASPWLSLRAAIKGSISGFASIGVADWETDPLTFVAPKNGWKIWEIGKPPTPTTTTTTTTTVAPVTVTTTTLPTGIGTRYLSLGTQHACYTTNQGSVKCWGRSSQSNVGIWPPFDFTSNVVQTASGETHVCFLLATGTVKCSGSSNSHGQLGNGTTSGASDPTDVIGLTGVTQITAYHDNTCALLSSGSVKCWGENSYGQLGDGTTTDRSVPTQVTGLTSDVVQVSTSIDNSCAVLSSGSVKCWGRNRFGQVGDGTTTDRYTPTQVTGLTSGATQVTAEGSYACAILSNGSVSCWGYNGQGNLGDGTTTDRYIPTQVSGLTSGVSQIIARSYTACALLTTGSLKCWGSNNQGQIGDGTTTDRYTPTQVDGLTSGVERISVGSYFACALLTSGLVKCWGDNTFGKLGDGSTTDQYTPVDVVGL